MGGELTCKGDRPALPERHEGRNPSHIRHQFASCHHLPIRQVSKRDLDSKPPVSLTRINREESYSGCESQRFLFTHLFSLHMACVYVCVSGCDRGERESERICTYVSHPADDQFI